MKILGNRILVSKIEEPEKEGFKTVEVQDSFVNKGKVEQVGQLVPDLIGFRLTEDIDIGSTILFAKYSPDTQDIEHEGKKYKVVLVSDIIAVL